MSEHEQKLRELGDDDQSYLLTPERAACLAGAEALRLVREYREAQKAHMENLGAERDSTVERIIAASRALLTETPR